MSPAKNEKPKIQRTQSAVNVIKKDKNGLKDNNYRFINESNNKTLKKYDKNPLFYNNVDSKNIQNKIRINNNESSKFIINNIYKSSNIPIENNSFVINSKNKKITVIKNSCNKSIVINKYEKEEMEIDKTDKETKEKTNNQNNLKDKKASKPSSSYLNSRNINYDLHSVKYKPSKKINYARLPFNLKVLYPQTVLMQMNWQGIKWIMENEKNIVKLLVDFHKTLKENSQSQERSYSQEDFYELMQSYGITKNHDLMEKLFYIFNRNKNGEINIKKLHLGLEIFGLSSLEKKLKTFYDFYDIEDSPFASKNEIIKNFEDFNKNCDKQKLKKRLIKPPHFLNRF